AVRNQDPRNARRAAQSAQDADCACAPGHRVSRLHDSAGSAPAPSAGDADQVERATRGSVRVSDAEVDRPVQGHGPPEDATSHSALDRGADPRTQSCDSRVGRVLQTRSRAEPLSPARWLGGATAMVAPLSPVALSGMEGSPDLAPPGRAGAGEPDRPDPFVDSATSGRAFVKAACGKTARAVWGADGGQRHETRLLRPDTRRSGEPATWGSGQRKESRSTDTWAPYNGRIGLLCKEKNRQPWKRDSNE